MRKILTLVLLVSNYAFGQTADNAITIGKRESLQSKLLNETRSFSVYLPRGYENIAARPEGYPVIYLLDGDDHFHSVSGLVQFLGSYSRIIPEMIVVAIPNTDRTRDLTPTHTQMMNGAGQDLLKTSGGNDTFLKFIQTELIPHIELTYRTKPLRIFIGHSLGGIAVINALYTMPETFNAYISIDPSLWWDDQVLLKKAKNHFLRADLKGKSLFISQANTLSPGDTANNHFESIREFATLLETRNKSGLRWKYEYYPDDTHGSAPLITEYDALRFLFDKYPRSAHNAASPEELLKMYADFSEQCGTTFRPWEGTINQLGYRAMNEKNLEMAQRYFQLAIDYYPQSPNAYDSMGELWMNKGDKKKAIVFYEKSLALDPKNENAKDNIKKMKDSIGKK
jgi:predicted alpha/beta superfamily hydrolase